MDEHTTIVPDVPVEVVPAPAPTDSIVEEWFVAHFYGRPISTDEFNRFRRATDGLKERLRAAQKE